VLREDLHLTGANIGCAKVNAAPAPFCSMQKCSFLPDLQSAKQRDVRPHDRRDCPGREIASGAGGLFVGGRFFSVVIAPLA